MGMSDYHGSRDSWSALHNVGQQQVGPGTARHGVLPTFECPLPYVAPPLYPAARSKCRRRLVPRCPLSNQPQQNIWQCAKNRAAAYPAATRAQYVSAAASLRFPYWDWAAKAALPPIVTQTQVTVTGPNGRVTMKNPLYQYTFASNGPGGPRTSDFPGNSAPQKFASTCRTPNSRGVSNHNAVNQALQSNAGYLHDATYLILTQTTNYAEFSNNGYSGTQEGYGSIENPHGTVHNVVGGNGGHMTYLDYSGFDPIFFLHHCNVDRLIAIWQAIHYESWDINQEDDSGTYSIASGTVEMSQTPLYPFSRTASGPLYTSDDVRNINQLGYTYPEIRSWGKSAAQNSDDVRAAIQALYDPNNLLSKRQSRNGKRGPAAPGGVVPPLDPSKGMVDGKYKQWALNIEVNKFARDNSYTVYFFMGPPVGAPADWLGDANLVASYPCLRPQNGTQVPADLKIYGRIPLTRSILEAVDDGTIENLQPEQTTPYLQKQLQWRLADINGLEIKIEEVPSLKIVLTDQDVTPPPPNARVGDRYPKYGKVTPHLDNGIKGKPGSAKKGDPLLGKIGGQQASPSGSSGSSGSGGSGGPKTGRVRGGGYSRD